MRTTLSEAAGRRLAGGPRRRRRRGRGSRRTTVSRRGDATAPAQPGEGYRAADDPATLQPGRRRAADVEPRGSGVRRNARTARPTRRPPICGFEVAEPGRGASAARRAARGSSARRPTVRLTFAHQVRVRGLEPLVAAERAREAADAALAANAADLDRLGLEAHCGRCYRAPTSAAQSASSPRCGRARLRVGLARVGSSAGRTVGAPARAAAGATCASSSRASSDARTRRVSASSTSSARGPKRAPPSGSAGRRCARRPGRREGGRRARSRERPEQRDERGRPRRRGRLVGDPELERAEARMRADVPPERGVVGGQAERDEPFDVPLPLRPSAANGGGAPLRGSSASTTRPVRPNPVSTPPASGELAESASTTGSHGSARPERVQARVAVGHADVDVQAR